MLTPVVRYVPHVISAADEAFERLVSDTAWSDQMRARRTASFGRPYNYSGQSYPEAPMPPLVTAIAEVAAQLAGHPFDNCLANFYESGRQRMGFHRDSYAELEPDSAIAIASLGATRTLVFRSNDGKLEVPYRLEHGSILLMDRRVQEMWRHGVPAVDASKCRISLTFRRFASR
jgi:alkylated DNA repair dioxygenase AlkB